MANNRLTKSEVQELPVEAVAQIKEKLKMYDETYVTYSNGKYHVSSSIGLSDSYADDHRFVGTVYAVDIFTAEEIRANIKEMNNYTTSY